jgi:hypothetical protein
MRMGRQLTIMAVALAALVAWERSLVRQAATVRSESARIVRVFDAETMLEGRPIAAIRIRHGDAIYLYIYHEGIWRCMQAHGAPALASKIDAIVPKLFAAEGVVQTTRAEEAAVYGVDTEETIRLALCGAGVLEDPTGDVILAIDIGRSIPATGGSFVRPADGGGEIWAVNVDFRDELAGMEQGMPPMLDPHVVPEAWPGWRTGLRRIVIEIAGDERTIVQRHERELSDEEQRAGMPSWQWTVERGDIVRPGDLTQLWTYTNFLASLPYAGILAPRPAEEIGLDHPRAVLTMESADGQRAQIVIGGSSPRGGVVALSTVARTVFELDPALVDALLPPAQLLTGEHDENPWDQWLRR